MSVIKVAGSGRRIGGGLAKMASIDADGILGQEDSPTRINILVEKPQ
jgi:hypothetical protein